MKKVIVDHGHNQCNCTYKLSSYDFCSLLDEIYIIFFKANNLKWNSSGIWEHSCPNITTVFDLTQLLWL